MTNNQPATGQTPDNHADPLASIWQQQKVQVLDTQKVMARWRVMRMKQWMYLAADVLGMLFALGACYYILLLKPESFWLTKFWVVLMTAMGGYMTFVFIQRRRLMLAGGFSSTEDYYQRLLQQCDNNIEVAHIGWKMCIWVFYLLVIYLISYWIFAEISIEDMLLKIVKTAGLAVFVGASCWWWCKGHIRRNQQEKSRLQALDSQTDIE